MGFRITGIDMPIGGASWEYADDKPTAPATPIVPTRKLNVFISSICGRPQYDAVCEELKEKIEHTGLAQVYLSEGEQASTMAAGKHYIYALEDSDVCIFLIDNYNGITPGVQAEIKAVQEAQIQTLYYNKILY